MTRSLARALGLTLLTFAGAAVADDAPAPQVPAHNAVGLTDAPPVPALGDAGERARLLFDAIVADDPARAQTLFLPRAAFRAIKASAQPDALYDRLLRAYERDIHALHASLAGRAAPRFVRLELSRRREWVRPGGEANRLPYWAQRHNWLVFESGGKEQRLEVRVLIAWDDRWYVTHLSEFRPTGARH